MKHKLIVFEGVDGCGKSTLSKLISLRAQAYWTFEPLGIEKDCGYIIPSEEYICNHLRTFVLDKSHSKFVPPISKELLLLANRGIHHLKIKEMLQICNVVSDRSWISGYVYKQVATPEFDSLTWVMVKSLLNLCTPDIVIYVESDTQKLKEGNNDIYDTAGSLFHARIKEKFEDFFSGGFFDIKPESIIRFNNDFNLGPEDNANKLFKIIKEKL
jgi:thymidylate kinase